VLVLAGSGLVLNPSTNLEIELQPPSRLRAMAAAVMLRRLRMDVVQMAEGVVGLIGVAHRGSARNLAP
jgi:hypothetical protein